MAIKTQKVSNLNIKVDLTKTFFQFWAGQDPESALANHPSFKATEPDQELVEEIFQKLILANRDEKIKSIDLKCNGSEIITSGTTASTKALAATTDTYSKTAPPKSREETPPQNSASANNKAVIELATELHPLITAVSQILTGLDKPPQAALTLLTEITASLEKRIGAKKK